MKSKIKHWRTGQYLFNLLEFMKQNGVSGNQGDRLADTFYISDDEFEELEKEFLKIYNNLRHDIP